MWGWMRRAFHVFPPAWWATVERPTAADELPKAIDEARSVRAQAESVMRRREMRDRLRTDPFPFAGRDREDWHDAR